MVSFQIGATFAKHLIPTIGAPGTTALRLGLSALLLLVLQRPWRTVPSRLAWPVVLAYGVSLGAMNSVFYLALRSIPLGIAVAHRVHWPADGRRPCPRGGRLDYLWVLLAAIGLAAAVADHAQRRGARSAPASSYALTAGVGWALYIVFRSEGRAGAGIKSASTWGLMIAALVTVLDVVSRMRGPTPPRSVSPAAARPLWRRDFSPARCPTRWR